MIYLILFNNILIMRKYVQQEDKTSIFQKCGVNQQILIITIIKISSTPLITLLSHWIVWLATDDVCKIGMNDRNILKYYLNSFLWIYDVISFIDYPLIIFYLLISCKNILWFVELNNTKHFFENSYYFIIFMKTIFVWAMLKLNNEHLFELLWLLHSNISLMNA